MTPVKSTPKSNASKAEERVNKKRDREEAQGYDDTLQPVEKKSKIQIEIDRLELKVKQCEENLNKEQEKLTDAKKRLRELMEEDQKKELTTEQRTMVNKLYELTSGEKPFDYENFSSILKKFAKSILGFEGGVFLSEAEIDAIDRRQRQEFNDVLRANYEVWKKKNTESNGPEATGSTTKE